LQLTAIVDHDNVARFRRFDRCGAQMLGRLLQSGGFEFHRHGSAGDARTLPEWAHTPGRTFQAQTIERV